MKLMTRTLVIRQNRCKRCRYLNCHGVVIDWDKKKQSFIDQCPSHATTDVALRPSHLFYPLFECSTDVSLTSGLFSFPHEAAVQCSQILFVIKYEIVNRWRINK